MHLGGVARSAGGAERKSRGREGEKFLIYTGPEGKPGGESRFPLSLKTDGVFNTKLLKKKKIVVWDTFPFSLFTFPPSVVPSVITVSASESDAIPDIIQ